MKLRLLVAASLLPVTPVAAGQMAAPATAFSTIAAWQLAKGLTGFPEAASQPYQSNGVSLGNLPISFDSAVVLQSKRNWPGWCCAYSGDLLWSGSTNRIRLRLPRVKALGFEVQPQKQRTEEIKIVLSNGQEFHLLADGKSYPKFFGFVGEEVSYIDIVNETGDAFAVGNFYYVPSDRTGPIPLSTGGATGDLVANSFTGMITVNSNEPYGFITYYLQATNPFLLWPKLGRKLLNFYNVLNYCSKFQHIGAAEYRSNRHLLQLHLCRN